MELYKTIQDIGNILDININQPPILYENEIDEYSHDTLKRKMTQRIIKNNDDIIYLLHTKELGNYYCDSRILKDVKDVYDIFVQFIRDSYYDSPVKFNNWKRCIEKNDNFLLKFNKHPKHFYMGLYCNHDLTEFYRVYIRKNKEDLYNEYITEKVIF